MQIQLLTCETKSTNAVPSIHPSSPLRPFPALPSPGTPPSREPAGPPLVETPIRRREAPISFRPATAWARSLAQDSSSQDLTNLSFAFSIYTTSLVGVAVLAWGTLLDSLWLAASGFLVTLAAWVLYGLARHDD